MKLNVNGLGEEVPAVEEETGCFTLLLTTDNWIISVSGETVEWFG